MVVAPSNETVPQHPATQFLRWSISWLGGISMVQFVECVRAVLDPPSMSTSSVQSKHGVASASHLLPPTRSGWKASLGSLRFLRSMRLGKKKDDDESNRIRAGRVCSPLACGATVVVSIYPPIRRESGLRDGSPTFCADVCGRSKDSCRYCGDERCCRQNGRCSLGWRDATS
jgi:hypothetical protein